jgi:alkylation response protein AidB-like acyl-CoA dehydrogenase
MDFAWSTAELERQRAARSLGSELGGDIVARDREGRLLPSDWLRLAEEGLLGALLPTSMGGGGRSLMELVAELEGLGETCHDAGLLFMLSAQSFAFVAPVLEHGSLSQQERRLRELAQGRLRGAFAMTEADSGSSAFELTTRAHREGDGFRLEGEKVWVALAPVADEALVIARTSDGSPLSSLSAFLVDLNLPGVHRGPAEDLSGLRTAPVGSLRFENVELPADALLGREGAGAFVFMGAMEWERIGIMAAAVGRMQSQLSRCVERARQRRIGGKAIREHQAISHRIAEMRCRVDGARLQLHRAAWAKTRGERVDGLSAQAKLVVSEAAVDQAVDAMRVHGALGLRRESGLERELRDAMMGLVYSGTSDIQRNLIASSEGL